MQIACIIFVAIATLSLVYAPQPLSPLLATYFGVSTHLATLLVSLTLLPMAIAPILYGYLLEKFSAKLLLIASTFICAILQILSTFADSFSLFLSIRLLQSIFFPAILTTLLTILTRISRQNIQRNVSFYVSATIAGGLTGRVLGGILTDIFDWKICFDIFACVMIVSGIWLFWIPESKTQATHLPKLKSFLPFLYNKRVMQILMSVFMMFFSFQAILTILPFWLKKLDSTLGESSIGMFYVSYLIGIFVSLFANKASILCKGKVNLIVIGFVIFGLGSIMLISQNLAVMFVGLFVVCAGCFTCHCTLNTILNSISKYQKGITNGLYLSFYYTGGVIGSFFPMFYYELFGWWILALSLSVLLFINAYLFWHNKAFFVRY